MANGLNFLIFTDENTKVTYQLGSDSLGDPYQDDALVSLSELSEVKFNDPAKFSCGQDFVVGVNSEIQKSVRYETLIQKVENSNRDSPF